MSMVTEGPVLGFFRLFLLSVVLFVQFNCAQLIYNVGLFQSILEIIIGLHHQPLKK